MTEQEKRQLVEAVITQLKNEGTDVSSASVVEDVNGVSYVLCYDTNGNIVRVSPDTINQQESTNKTAIEALGKKVDDNGTDIANETKRAKDAEQTLGMKLQNGLNQEATARGNLAKEIKSNAMQYDTLGVYVRADKAEIYGRSIDTTPRVVEFPAATTEKAGVMSAEDKKKVNASIKNIDVNPNEDDVELDLEDNTEKTSHVVFPAATPEKAGVMSAEDKEILDSLNKVLGYEIEATFNNGFIIPKNGNLPITDNSTYVHSLIECIEGQKFTVVSARATTLVFAWQFLDSANNILTKYDGGNTPVVDAVITAPLGAKKLLVNSLINVNPSVKYRIDSINKLSYSIEELNQTVETYDDRISSIEGEFNNIKSIVGEPSSTIDLTASNYSGLVYNGITFSRASTSYDSFIFPLNKGVTYKLIDNTGLGYAKAGISSVFTFSATPALGEMGYIRKPSANILQSFTPQDDERYLVLVIYKPYYTDNNFTYISESIGLFKRVEELENNSNPLQGKTILCLGDSITELRHQDKRYSDYLAEITGANVINGGIGGTQMSRRKPIPTTSTFAENRDAYACLDLPSIAYALKTGDFTMQEAAAQWLISDSNPEKTGDDNTAIIETLKGVDLNSVDIVTIFIGTNDIGRALGTIGASGNDTTALDISQGFYEIIKNLLTKNPNLRIYYYCPMPRYFGDIRTFDPSTAATDPNWCDNYEANGIKFPDMVDHQIKLAEYFKIPVCDMYRTMGINQWNILSIMKGDTSDGTHPYKGFRMIANKIASFIIANNNLNV